MAPNTLIAIRQLIEILDNLPRLIKETRRARHLNLLDAGEQSGVNATTLHRIERGDTGYRMEHVPKLLRWIDQPPPPSGPEILKEDLHFAYFHAAEDRVNQGPSGVQLVYTPTGAPNTVIRVSGHGSQLANKAVALDQLKRQLRESNGEVQPGIPGLHAEPGVEGSPRGEVGGSQMAV
jgi:transcriptional regulator with XRE-family HTH domain